MRQRQDRRKHRFKLLNQFHPVTMISSTTPGTHNPRINALTVTNRLLGIGERSPYIMYVLYAAFLFWPSIYALILTRSRLGLFLTFVLWPLIDVRILFPLNILRTKWREFHQILNMHLY